MRTVEWYNGMVRMIDQKRLPWELIQVDLPNVQAVADAITDMTVRGAPAIGASAAFGMAIAAQESRANTLPALLQDLHAAAALLKASRPTAVNLAWAVDYMLKIAVSNESHGVDELRAKLLAESQRIADEDVLINQRMGAHGANLIKDGCCAACPS